MSAPAFSRRLFLGGIASLGVAAAVKVRSEVPILWGDLIHDDAPAINALFRGEPIRVLGGRTVQGERPALRDARCLIGSTLMIDEVDHVVMTNTHLVAAPDFHGTHLVKIANAKSAVLGTMLDLRQSPRLTAALIDRPGLFKDNLIVGGAAGYALPGGLQ